MYQSVATILLKRWMKKHGLSARDASRSLLITEAEVRRVMRGLNPAVDVYRRIRKLAIEDHTTPTPGWQPISGRPKKPRRKPQHKDES